MRYGANERRPFVVERKGERRPSKPKPWSHQDDLRTMIGKSVVLIFVDPKFGSVCGVLAAADQFTLQLRVDGHKSPMTYFKHAIVAFGLQED
jgi:hypothetical protein